VDWIAAESKLGNPALEAIVNRTQDADLARALKWSKAVNQAVDNMVRGVPPFPYVRECLQKLQSVADLMVISATPNAALEKEWNEHDIAQYVTAICGQESGSKTETLANAAKYPADQALMIGDAPGDYRAAVENSCLFFPINPGNEEASWRRFYDEGINRFLSRTFTGAYQEALLAEFDRCLPDRPAWPVTD
jgi:phosphoglycolate phosphatase-like HAD superfamily hydrolase